VGKIVSQESVCALIRYRQAYRSRRETSASTACHSGGSDCWAKMWLEKLAKVDQERRGYLRLAGNGHMSDEELDALRAEL
jgi:hypothetical protein